MRSEGGMSRLQKELFPRGEVAQLQDGGSDWVLMSFGDFVPVHLPAGSGTGVCFAGWPREAEEWERSSSTVGSRCACHLGIPLILLCIAATPSETRLLCAEALCPESSECKQGDN